MNMMNLTNILNGTPNVSFTISAEDLKEVIMFTIIHTKEEMERVIIEDKSEEYLTVKEATELLGVSTITLYRWRKSGYLSPINIGKELRYPKSILKSTFFNKRKSA